MCQTSRIKYIGFAAATVLAWLCQVRIAAAHASEQVLVLLLPTDIYIMAGCGTVFVSILTVALLPPRWLSTAFSSVKLLDFKPPVQLQNVLSLLSLALLIILAITGVLGPHDPVNNLFSLVLWTVCWVSFIVLHGIFGNLWAFINPWKGLYYLIFGSATRTNKLLLPNILGQWPAAIILLLFGLFMIADPAPEDPEHLMVVVAAYWVFTFVGMILFGQNTWLKHCEAFTVLFGLLALMAPIRWEPSLRFGMPGWALISKGAVPVSLAVFCLLFLGIGSFDGLRETFWWLSVIGVNPLEFPGRSAIITSSILGLITFSALLTLTFWISVSLGVKIANAGLPVIKHVSPTNAFRQFATSIIPIALGFHFAHFLIYFLVNEQYLLLALTDPFSTGANYLNLSRAHITTGFLNAKDTVFQIFLIQAFVVVAAHVIAVFLTHSFATSMYQTRKSVFLCQLPLAVFMIFYTLFGLWLLAAPRGM